jgi:hypothetical protein
MKKLLIVSAFFLASCSSMKVVKTEDITTRTQWLESSEDNPIINVVQKVYANDDLEIVIKKKYTTDYVKIMQRRGKKIINKKTNRNYALQN